MTDDDLADRVERFPAALHDIDAAAAMDMWIDETGRHDELRGIDRVGSCRNSDPFRRRPASAMEFPSMITRPGENRFAGVKSVPASIATILLTAASEVRQDTCEGCRRIPQSFCSASFRCNRSRP